MKITIPYLNDYNSGTDSHSIIITSPQRIICIKKAENGGWLNGKWEGKGTYEYSVILHGNLTYRISEETFNMLEEVILRHC